MRAAKAGKPKTEIDEDKAIAMIADGKTQRQIAEFFGVAKTTFRDWVASNPDRSARAREASTIAAQSFAEMAIEAIDDAADQFELSKAKELAHHYRWAASKADSARYGDRQAVDVTSKIEITIEQVDEKIARLLGK